MASRYSPPGQPSTAGLEPDVCRGSRVDRAVGGGEEHNARRLPSPTPSAHLHACNLRTANCEPRGEQPLLAAPVSLGLSFGRGLRTVLGASDGAPTRLHLFL
ncbi:hypothetical protein NDU88_004783 [Pleurodeles waltl]|uniref:Uncharacterized protein n=1 Tax=Pleurodeles waltl TaxID=8319 RepID=A0AAV7RIC2_PLEWA|nr:hypothetical protein NDU88_004783 [Pleurodeles waltl]